MEEIEFTASEVVTAQHAVLNAKNKLQAVSESRRIARKREFRIRRQVFLWGKKEQHDQWLSDIGRKRLEEKINKMRVILTRGTFAINFQLSREQRRVESLNSNVYMLECKVKTIKADRERNIKLIRHAFGQSIRILKHKIASLRSELEQTKIMFQKNIRNFVSVKRK